MRCSQGPSVSAKNRAEVLVPAGNGTVGGMGSYAVAAFFLDVTEVTVAAYRECLNSTDANHCTRAPLGKDMYGYTCNFSECPGTKEKHPVNCIDWQQADEFCRWAGRRLPTEVEWEYAAGGTAGMPPSKYPWGADEPVKGAGAQLCWSGTDGTCEVDSFTRTLLGARNQLGGVADLAGNVWEWTSSTYANPYTHPAKSFDPKKDAACSDRGGSWSSGGLEYYQVAHRSFDQPSYLSSSYGVRCARTP